MNQTTTALLLFAAALAIPSCETPQQQSAPPSNPAGKAHAKWVNCDESEPKVPGKYEQTDVGAVVTLPNGHKYITKNVEDAVQLIFPNGQVFSSETAKSDANPAFVNEDETLVAATRRPATQTGDLHIYLKGSKGKYRELPAAHRQVTDVLGNAYDNVGEGVFALRAISGRTLTLWATERRRDGCYRFEFKLKVAPDGKIALAK
ncbi:MAG TPA: hypothetical protein VNP98_06500 [Chthoniobacterales bacterium]|nr:hypothetical protein [Chthoniobacterales bacterium]